MPDAAPTSAVTRRLVDLLQAHPIVFVAVKSAIAAGLAWLVVRPMGGAANEFPYYAPLGAVVVMSTSAVTSVRTSVQSVLAIGLGAAIAIAGTYLPGPQLLALMLVIGVGTALSVWQRLGAMGVWVPFAALFVLILGGNDPWQYVFGYAGLTALGAGVGVLVNLTAPQLPLARTLHAVTALRAELAQQLRTLAEHISSEGDLLSQSRHITSTVQRHARYLEQLVSEVREARQVNWRAGRWQRVVDEREEQARALERMAYLVDEVAALLSRSDGQLLIGGSSLGDAIAEALTATAAMVEAGSDAYTEDDGGRSPYGETRRQVQQLRRRLLEHSPDSAQDSDDLLIASSVIVSLERALDVWA
jgi:uncharacterized membrane protein YgaE (UPF0421/DUF939 family)